jgi:hypothetical protein
MTARHHRGEHGQPGVAPSATPRGPRRRRREVEDDEYVAFVRRILRALSRRAGVDVVTLADLAALRDEVEGHVVDAVARLRHDPVAPASWAEIGRALGISRRRAWQRFGKVGGTRRAGGQPGEWR